MKIFFLLLVLFIFSIKIFAQTTIDHSVNSGSGSYTTPTISVDYVVGEPLVGIENFNFSFTTIPLADLTDSSSGIYTINNISFKVYPNPVSQFIVFSISEQNHYEIALFDINGVFISTLHSD